MQTDSLFTLTDLVLDARKSQNLTAIKTKDEIVQKLIVDALTLLPVLDDEKPSSVIDIGTGAGFPGLVLAIARPEYHITLLDSVRKKIDFTELAMNELALPNVSTVWGRAEDIGQDSEFRERFCIAVARSVAEMRVLAELSIPFVKCSGCFLAQKSVDEDQSEIKAAARSVNVCGGSIESIRDSWPLEWGDTPDYYKVGGNDERKKAIIVVRKKVASPRKYPRKAGVPKKLPL